MDFYTVRQPENSIGVFTQFTRFCCWVADPEHHTWKEFLERYLGSDRIVHNIFV